MVCAASAGTGLISFHSILLWEQLILGLFAKLNMYLLYSVFIVTRQAAVPSECHVDFFEYKNP